ncbi:MAG: ABC transporter substrate-binding protein [Burkholderiaceae bacterium]|nr:ABC transporter substrate-binding protein [Burkholderiaceae bacterium]
MGNRKRVIELFAMAGFALAAACAQADEPIRIGVPILFSGPGAFVGDAQKRTLDMQVEAINAKGGLGNRKIELIYYDTEGKPDVAVRMFNRLIKNDRVVAILGPSASWEAMPVKPILEASGTPSIMLASTAAIVDPVAKCVFKTPPDDRIVVERLYQHLKGVGQTRIALLSSQDAFGDGGRKELVSRAKAHGLEIVSDERYSMEDVDLSALLNKIKRTNAQAVVNWSSSRAPVVMTMNYRQVGLSLPLYHSHAVLSPSFLKATGANAEGILVAGPKLDAGDDLPGADPQRPAIMRFREQFQTRYQQPANQFGAAAYDALNILAAAIQRSGTDPAKLCAAIEQTRDYVGVYGVFNYSPTDHGGLTKDALTMFQVVNGAWKALPQ